MILSVSISAAIPMVKLKSEERAVRKLLDSIRQQIRSAKVSNDRDYLTELFEREDELKGQLHSLEEIYTLVNVDRRSKQTAEKNASDMEQARSLYEQYKKKYNT